MEFRFTDEQDTMGRIARDFADNEIVPFAGVWDKNREFPVETLKRMHSAGLLTIGIPEEYGGAGLDHVSQALVTEEIARGDAGIAAAMVASTLIGSNPVLVAGTHEQKKWWYGMELEGCLTALCQAGPDAHPGQSIMEVDCRRCGDEYILNGCHQSVYNGAGAGMYAVFASLDNSAGTRGTCVFMVDHNTAGIGVDPLSQAGMRSSDNATVIYDDVRVPAGNLLGKEGDGVNIAALTQSIARVTTAAMAVGVAQATFEAVAPYSLQRYQFGKPIYELPEVYSLLADMAHLIEHGRLAHLIAANMLDGNFADDETLYQTRYLCTEIGLKATRDALQIYGGPGLSVEFPVEKYYRDARILKYWLEQPRLKKILSPAI